MLLAAEAMKGSLPRPDAEMLADTTLQSALFM